MKTLSIPRLTEGAEPLKITIAKLTNATIRRALAMQMQCWLGSRERAVKWLEDNKAAEAAAARYKLEADRQLVIDCIGTDEGIDIEALQTENSPYYINWLIAERILHNPIYVEICSGLSLADFEDVDFDDFARVCREIMRVNETFFSAAQPALWKECQKHQDQPTA